MANGNNNNFRVIIHLLDDKTFNKNIQSIHICSTTIHWNEISGNVSLVLKNSYKSFHNCHIDISLVGVSSSCDY